MRKYPNTDWYLQTLQADQSCSDVQIEFQICSHIQIKTPQYSNPILLDISTSLHMKKMDQNKEIYQNISYISGKYPGQILGLFGLHSLMFERFREVEGACVYIFICFVYVIANILYLCYFSLP